MSEEQKKKSWYKRWWAISLFAFFGLMIFGAMFGGNDSSQDSEQTSAAINEPVIIISDINSFLEEFDANEIRAEDKYEGKIVSVNGRVDSINEGVFGPYLMLRESEYDFSGIDCTFNKEDQNEFIALSKDDYVTVNGKVSDYVIGSVVLDDCTLAD